MRALRYEESLINLTEVIDLDNLQKFGFVSEENFTWWGTVRKLNKIGLGINSVVSTSMSAGELLDCLLLAPTA